MPVTMTNSLQLLQESSATFAGISADSVFAILGDSCEEGSMATSYTENLPFAQYA